MHVCVCQYVSHTVNVLYVGIICLIRERDISNMWQHCFEDAPGHVMLWKVTAKRNMVVATRKHDLTYIYVWYIWYIMVFYSEMCEWEKEKHDNAVFALPSCLYKNPTSFLPVVWASPIHLRAELLSHFLCQDESSKMMLLHISNTRLQNPRASLPAKHGRSSDCCPSAEVDACNMSVALGRSDWLWLYTLSQLHTGRVNIKPYVDQWSVFFSHDRTKRSCFRQILQEVSELDLNSTCLKISYCRTGAAAHDFERARQTLWNMAQQLMFLPVSCWQESGWHRRTWSMTNWNMTTTHSVSNIENIGIISFLQWNV